MRDQGRSTDPPLPGDSAGAAAGRGAGGHTPWPPLCRPWVCSGGLLGAGAGWGGVLSIGLVGTAPELGSVAAHCPPVAAPCRSPTLCAPPGPHRPQPALAYGGQKQLSRMDASTDPSERGRGGGRGRGRGPGRDRRHTREPRHAGTHRTRASRPSSRRGLTFPILNTPITHTKKTHPRAPRPARRRQPRLRRAGRDHQAPQGRGGAAGAAEGGGGRRGQVARCWGRAPGAREARTSAAAPHLLRPPPWSANAAAEAPMPDWPVLPHFVPARLLVPPM
jgi:hypothetical protein